MLMIFLRSCILSLLAIILSGCIGLGLTLPLECKNEKPALNARDSFYHSANNETSSATWLTKQVFLNNWGKPDSIKTISEYKEIWRYENHIWCGVIPCFVVCVPLLLPVCDGFAEIEFHDNSARLLDVKRSVTGMLLLMPLFAAGDSVCRNVTPTPLKQKIETGKVVYLNVTYDVQKHESEAVYAEATNQIRDLLSKELVNDGIFTAVALDPGQAGYTMDVTVDYAHSEEIKGSDEPAHYDHINLSVSLANNSTKQIIGDFEILENDRYSPIKSSMKTGSSLNMAVKQIINTLSY